jgi:protoporphyrinogen/coproporphyrinogen III oxidase
MQSQARIVIVGGGVSGLATAHYLHRLLGSKAQLTLVEGGPKLGGKVATTQFGGHLVDTGPDALLVRMPAMAALLGDLGLNEQIVAPAALGAHIWSRGRLRRLPTGTLFGVPDRLLPLLKSRLLSPAGLARAALDLVLPPRHSMSSDPSIADLVSPRLGSQVFDRLVEPLLGGVHAGRAAELSARSTVPEIAAIARKNRSLYFGLRKLRRHAPPSSGGPILVSLEGGLGGLVEALASRLGNGDVRLDSAARAVVRVGDGYRVDLVDGPSVEADAVVLATPAFVTSRLLTDLSPDVATVLTEIPYVDVATIWLAYPRSAVQRPLDGTGFLVPPEEGKLLVGCTWSSAKWPQLADDSTVLIRCMVGRRGDTRWLSMDDDTLLRTLKQELGEAMGLTAAPLEHRIHRWPKAMPQYLVGHQERLDVVGAALRHLPGLYLTGAGYRGVGLASCATDAQKVAAALAEYITNAEYITKKGVVHDVPEALADARPMKEMTS